MLAWASAGIGIVTDQDHRQIRQSRREIRRAKAWQLPRSQGSGAAEKMTWLTAFI